MNPQQPIFDKLLARTMNMIYADGTTDKIAETLKQGDPVSSIENMTNAIMGKVKETAQASKKQIPKEMLPDLTLAVTSQIADIAKASGTEVTDDMTLKAFQNVVAKEVNTSVKNGGHSPEEVMQAVQQLKAKQGGQEAQAGARQTPINAQTPPTPSPTMPQQQMPPQSTNDPFKPQTTMTEQLRGGLLR